MGVNMLNINFVIVSIFTAFFMKPHVLKLLSKTVLQRGKIDITLKLPELSLLMLMLPLGIGLMQLLLSCTS
jgi:hypothetical protein